MTRHSWSEYKRIDWKGNLLPGWLFVPAKNTVNFVSPAATFNPAVGARAAGHGMQSLTTPAARLTPKSLIIDRQMRQQGLDAVQLDAMIAWFLSQKIPVYLCLQGDPNKQFIKCEEGSQYTESLLKLDRFEPGYDSEALADTFKLERDKTAALSLRRAMQLQDCLYQCTRQRLTLAVFESESTDVLFRRMRWCDVTAFGAHFPSAGFVNGQFVSFSEDVRGCLDLSEKSLTPAESAQNIIRFTCKKGPMDIRAVMKLNRGAITKEFARSIYDSFPELRDVITPLSYECVGLLPNMDCDYYVHLKSCLSASDLPLSSDSPIIANPSRGLFDAYPELITRLPEVLSREGDEHSGRCWGFICFALKRYPELLPIVLKAVPIKDKDTFDDYMEACPEQFKVILSQSPLDIFKHIDVDSLLGMYALDASMRSTIGPILNEIVQSGGPGMYSDIWRLCRESDPSKIKDIMAALLKQPCQDQLEELYLRAAVCNDVFLHFLSGVGLEYNISLLNCYMNYNMPMARRLAGFLTIVVEDRFDMCSYCRLHPDKSPVVFRGWVGNAVDRACLKYLTDDNIVQLFEGGSGDFENVSMDEFLKRQVVQFPEVQTYLKNRLARSMYGTAAHQVEYMRRQHRFFLDHNVHDHKDMRRVASGIVLSKMRADVGHVDDDVARTQGCTYLSIGLLDDGFDYESVFSRFPNLKHIRLCCVSASEVVNKAFFTAARKHYPGIVFHIDSAVFESQSRFGVGDIGAQPEDEAEEDTAGIYIGGELSDAVARAEAEPAVFHMSKAGSLLNKAATPHRFRTKIVCISDDYKRKEDFSARLRPVDLRQAGIVPVSKDVVERFAQAGGDSAYYHLNLAVEAGQVTRLISAGVSDELVALGQDDDDLELFRGSDDFYYVKNDRPMNLQAVIKATALYNSPIIDGIDAVDLLGEDDPIRDILTAYYAAPGYNECSCDYQLKGAGESESDWFERMYANPGGACDERCMAVWYQIHKHESLRDRVRQVNIDNNHVRLEVKRLADGAWLQVEVGGIAAKVLKREADSVYKPKSVVFGAALPTDSVSGDVQTRDGATPGPGLGVQSKSAVKQPPDSQAYLYIRELLKADRTATVLHDIHLLLDKTPGHVLAIDQDTHGLACNIVRGARVGGVEVFVVGELSQLHIDELQLHLDTPELSLSKVDALKRFVERNCDNPNAVLLIEWDSLTPKQKVMINTVIDPRSTLFGREMPFQIVSLCKTMPDDRSFLGRHRDIYQVSTGPAVTESLELTASHSIDLLGLPDVMAALCGGAVVDDNKIRWQPSKFVELLMTHKLDAPIEIILRNIPQEQRDVLACQLEMAKARGYIDYHHCRIPLADTVDIKVARTDFDFKHFAAVSCQKNTNPIAVPPGSKLINSTLFDCLLADKDVKDGRYKHLIGLLEHSKDSRLDLLITSNLSRSQWYCLINQAKHFNVDLRLHCTDAVSMPDDLVLDILPAMQPQARVSSEAIVFVCDDPKACLPMGPDNYSFAIEDYSYEDIAKAIRYTTSDDGFSDFVRRDSDVLTALAAGKTVNLYGEFSDEMLQSLHPLMHAQAVGNSQFTGKLQLFIEQRDELNLSFIPAETVQRVRSESAPCVDAPIHYAEAMDASIDLTDSVKRNKAFMQGRVDQLCSSLEENRIVKLVGETGVGKTHLLHTLAQEGRSPYKVYYELDQVEQWLEDKGDRSPLLFLDEVNIRNMHLTFLEPLQSGGQPRVLYAGKIHTLTEHHRVVCAANPISYGGGRVEQKLFEQARVPEIHLEQIPYYVIYEEMLKPLYDSVKEWVTESHFKFKCQKLFVQHKDRTCSGDVSLCVRDIAEELAVYFSKVHHTDNAHLFYRQQSLERVGPIRTDLVLTPSIKPLEKALSNAIKVRKQRHLLDERMVLGKNGVLIEGCPGMGKSELVRYRLHLSGYQKVSRNTVPPEGGLSYVKLDASLSMSELKASIRHAFNQGQAVWLDEVNCLLDDGFEQWINAFMSGVDPDNHAPAIKPGFMLLVTANGVGMEGRSLIGPALRGRMTTLQMPLPTLEDMRDIVRSHNASQNLGLTPSMQARLATDLHAVMRDEPGLSLRAIIPKLKQCADYYISLPRAVVSQKDALKSGIFGGGIGEPAKPPSSGVRKGGPRPDSSLRL